MALTSMDAIINRAITGFTKVVPFRAENQAALVRPVANSHYLHRMGQYTIPTMETGVTKYIPSGAWHQVGTGMLRSTLITREILLGTLTIPSTYVQGSSLGNIIELGVTRQEALPVLMEVTTAMGGTAGTFTWTYTDQDANSAAGPNTAMTNANLGNAQFLTLNAGDIGAYAITAAAVTGGTAPTGVVKLWATQILAMLPPTVVGHNQIEPFLGALLKIYRLSAGDLVGFWAIQSSTTVNTLIGGLCFVGDD